MLHFQPWRRSRAAAATLPEGEALVARLAAGDTAVLDALYRREAAAVYRYALALCGNAAWAADATQEAFVALATRPQAYDPGRSAPGAYLAGVARHTLLGLWRAQRQHAPLDDDEEAADAAAADAGPSPESLLVRAQDGAQVRDAMRQLPPLLREALVLVDLQERPYADAAQICGCGINTLRTRLHRARLKLAALLGADGRSIE